MEHLEEKGILPNAKFNFAQNLDAEHQLLLKYYDALEHDQQQALLSFLRVILQRNK